MTVITKTIGRLPVNLGDYDSSRSYGRKNRVFLYGCEWESKIENNTYAPATLNTSTGVITPDTTHWKLVSGSYEMWLVDHDYGKISAANVKDVNQGNKSQQTINTEVIQEVAALETAVGTGGTVDQKIAAETDRAQNAESTLGRKVTTLETAVGSGGSVDSRIAAAKAEIKGTATSACDTLGEAEALISAEATARANAVSAETSRAQAVEQSITSTVTSRLDTQDAEIALLNGAEVIVVEDHTQVSSPDPQKIYRKIGDTSYTDWMNQTGNANDWKAIATYNPGIDPEPTIDSNNLVKSGGVAEVNGYYEENPEYLGAIIDKDRKLLEATLPNGKKYLPAGADFGSVEFNEIESPEFLSVEKDSSNHILGGYDRNGKQILSLPSNQDDLLQEQIDDLSDISKTLSEIKELQSIPPTIEVPRNNKANSLTRVNAFNQVWSLVNGLGMLKDMSNNNVTLQTDKFSHDSTLVSDGNRLYCIYVRNDVSTGDASDNQDAYVAMAVINKNDLSVIQNYVIAKHGDSINGDTVRLGCGTPNAYLVDSNTVRILFNASLSDEIGYIFYRDYDIQNDTLGTVGVCTLTIDNVEYPFSDKTLHDVYGVQQYLGMISLNSQIGYDENSGKYYAGLCLIDRLENSIIVESDNLINYEVWTIPQFSNECHAEYEGACVVWNNKLFYALRQRFGKMDMLLARFNLQTKAIEQEALIPDSNSRPCWVVQDSYRLNLLHNLDGRGLIEVVELYSQDISDAVVIAQVPASGCAYPSVVKLGNTFYFSASANVKVFKFEKFIYLSESKLINRLFTFLN